MPGGWKNIGKVGERDIHQTVRYVCVAKRDWMGMEKVRGYFQGGNLGFGNVFLRKGDEEGAHHGVQQRRSRLVASTVTDAKV